MTMPSSGSEEEIYSRSKPTSNNEKRDRPKRRPRRKQGPSDSPKKGTTTDRKKLLRRYASNVTPARVYLFNFFFYSAFGSLMPFMPVFFKLLGFSSLQNGILFAVRPLISFWWGPLIASFATSSKFRSLILFTCVAGAIASTFCISVVRTNDGGILKAVDCGPTAPKHIGVAENQQKNYSLLHHFKSERRKNKTFHMTKHVNNTSGEPYNWKKYIKDTGKKLLHRLKEGILMKNMFLSVLLLTTISEIFMSPTLHIAQASIKFKSNQPLLNNLCLNRVFSKIGMTVSALSISYVAWKYRCIFKNVHYFYFHFYGFLATGCITTMISLILPRESPKRTSFVTMVCNSCLSVVFDWNNFGYIFGLWIAGIAEGAISAFILWYASENGASEIIIGALVALAMVTDMVLHFSVGFSMKWIGHTGLLSIGIFFMSVQFFILTRVTNPLYMIPTQLLSGAASCCVRSSFIGCAQSNGSKEMEKVMFFVFQAAYMGLGLGLGGIFVSMPFYVFGPQKTFSALSIMAVVYSMFYAMIQIIQCSRHRRRPKKMMYTKLNTCDPKGDWLVDALIEEEEQQLKKDTASLEEGEISNTESHGDREIANNNESNGEGDKLPVT
eukprot:Seg1582.9 transcript_id=Seg1582.9/GoldUCD/mRNA.D3Y31 product="Major facilitator superfamily domain-containing protein 6-like" protein_id=Seg1582.9/GoldUCD/D3Y31